MLSLQAPADSAPVMDSQQAMLACHALLEEAEEISPQWGDWTSRMPLGDCDSRALASLMCVAPGDFCRGVVFACMTTRAAAGVVSGRGDPPLDVRGRELLEEARAIGARALRAARTADARWFSQHEGVDIELASREELMELLTTAPTTFMLGYIWRKLVARSEVAVITGRTY